MELELHHQWNCNYSLPSAGLPLSMSSKTDFKSYSGLKVKVISLKKKRPCSVYKKSPMFQEIYLYT